MLKLLRSSIFALALTGTLAFSARAQEAAPLTQVQGALTLRITELAWKPYAEFAPRSPSQFIPAAPQVMTITFALEGAPVARRTARRGAGPESSVRVFAIAPDGGRIEAERVSETQRVWNDWPAIDPRWKTMKLQFDWIPPRERNQEQTPPETVAWADVPIPSASAAPQPLAGGPREVVTASGVRVRLDASMLRVKPDDPIATARFYGRWLPPLDDPARCVEIEETRGANREGALTFDNGAPPVDRKHRVSVSQGHEVDKRDDTPGTFTISAPLLEGAKNAQLLVGLRAPRRAYVTPADAVVFNLAPPMPAPLPAPLPVAAPGMAPIAQKQLGAASLQLQPLQHQPENGTKWSWRGQLLLDDPTAAAPGTAPGDDEIAWTSTTVGYKAPGINDSTGLRSDNFWRSDGAALKTGQKAWQVNPQFSFKADRSAPEKVNIETKWERVRTSNFALRFADLPVPAAGTIVDVEKTVDVGEFGTFTVRKVGAFTEEQPLSPLLSKRAQKFQPPYGLAVVLEHKPTPAHKTYGLTWNLTTETARDSRGRDLPRTCDAAGAARPAGGDELLAADAPADKTLFTTIYLLPASPDAKTFALSMRAVRRTILDRQTITFEDVALPAP